MSKAHIENDSYSMENEHYDELARNIEDLWGESFHFAARWNGESLREGMKRHEHFIALQLGLKPGDKVLDVGCGIGGPLREIARLSYASITGLNNSEAQIARGKELNRIAGVDKTCNLVKADFMKMPFPDSSFDAVYAIEATCHAPNVYECFKEIFRVLKPGQRFAAFECGRTDSFDTNNQEHRKIKEEIVICADLPDLRPTGHYLEALKQAGFEVIWEKDIAIDSPVPWYLPLDNNHKSWSDSCRIAMEYLLFKALKFVGLAPRGSQNIRDFAGAVAEGGRKGIITPMFFFLARKPPSD